MDAMRVWIRLATHPSVLRTATCDCRGRGRHPDARQITAARCWEAVCADRLLAFVEPDASVREVEFGRLSTA